VKLFSNSSRLVVVALLLLVSVLAACGDAATTVPASSTTAASAPTTAAAVATTAATATTAAVATTAATATTAAVATTAATTAATATTAAAATTSAATTTTSAADTSTAGTTAAATSATGTGATAGTGATTGSADIPVYTGATELTLPDAITSQFASSVGSSVKNAKVQAYKVSDSPDAVTTFFKSGFTSGGWTDLSAQVPASSTAALSGTGLTLIGPFAKAPNVAVVMVGSGALFATAGVPGVTSSDTVYLVFQGNA